MTYHMYYKLVRDKVPEILKDKGLDCGTKLAEGEEYFNKVCEKLCEETEEFINNRTLEELVDVLEVIYAALHYMDYSLYDLQELAQAKASAKGSYSTGTILEWVEE